MSQPEARTINCVICYNDVSKYVVLDCLHFIGLGCFLNMVRHDDWRCPICRSVFHINTDSDSDPLEELSDTIHRVEHEHDEQLLDLRTNVHRIENSNENNFNYHILNSLFLILIIIINNIFHALL